MSVYRITEWFDQIQSRGDYTFSIEDAVRQTGRSVSSLRASLRNQKKLRRIFSPRRGFYVLVPPEYRKAISPPPSWYIDDLMKYFGQPYYVGILTAADYYGASHQKPMVFQVVTNKPTKPISVGNVRILFYMNSNIDDMPVKTVLTETGSMKVGTPETTAFDLVHYHYASGYFNNIVTILTELVEAMDSKLLVSLAKLMKLPDVQRLGFLLDSLNEVKLSKSLESWLIKKSPRSVVLCRDAPQGKSFDKRWHIYQNTELDSDL